MTLLLKIEEGTVTKWTNQKTALLLKLELLLNGEIKRQHCYKKKESDNVTKNSTFTKWTNQKTALLLKIESDTVTKNNGPIGETLKRAKYIRRSEKRLSHS